MNRSFIRWAALACSALTLGFISAGAWAQSCPAGMGPYSLVYMGAGSAPGLVPTTPGAAGSICAADSVPVCTIVGPNAAQIAANGITLVANCSGATSYAWTVVSSQGGAGGTCAGASTQSCTDTGSASEYPTSGTSVAYTVTGTGSLGKSSATQTVTWSTTPPAAPSGCSISGAPAAAQAAGYQATLTMNCTSGGAATVYAWTGTGAAGQTTQSVGPITVNSTTTFTATASNATGTSAPASATVNITGSGGGGSVVCSGFPSTLSESVAWDGPGGVGATSLTTYNTGGFNGNGALVVQFKTPAITTPPTRGVGSISLVEFSGPPTPRTGSLSTTPCDFGTGITGQAGLSSTFAGNPEPKFYFTLGMSRPGYIQLQPSTTYYLNVDNFYNGTNECSPGPTCDVKVTLTKQPGT